MKTHNNPHKHPVWFFDELCRAANHQQSQYSGGTPGTVSATTLIQPCRITVLKERHKGELIPNIDDMLPAMMGTAWHRMFEESLAHTLVRGPRDADRWKRARELGIFERRFTTEIEGTTLTGQVDRLWPDSGRLLDHKVTSVWSVKNGGKLEWEQQGNTYRWLAFKEMGITINDLWVAALMRDWRPGEALKYPDYPKSRIFLMHIPKWDLTTIEKWIKMRIRALEAARIELPLCSETERWAEPPKWAVMKKGKQRAMRVLDSEEGAMEWMKKHERKVGNVDKLSIEYRPGKSRRCEQYCPVSEFCSQWKEM